MTLPCGGRDSSTLCDVVKDPATAHKDQDAWRRPVVRDGIAHPMEGTDGKPKRIPVPKEAGAVVERTTRRGETYRVRKTPEGFPEFTVFESYLEDEHINSKDSDEHFRAANRRLAALIKEDPGRAEQMGLNERQVSHILKIPASADPPEGFTWHHHENAGKMQLVDRELHKRFMHIGGMEIWGGSRSA